MLLSDSGSGIKEVSISVGTTADNTEILPWTVIDNENFQWTTSSVSVTVPDGINGWVKLRAINNGKDYRQYKEQIYTYNMLRHYKSLK